MRDRSSTLAGAVCSGAAFALFVAATAPARAAPMLPEIRITSANPVPACVTPERLMAFLRSRNPRVDPRFKDIAHHYRHFGEGWRVRWDYAFFQMAIETNFLSYRAPNGRMGDVDPRQNNFAGIGTTGGGVPGDKFPDVKTGVLAQIQHLVVYSGERVAAPVAPRTRLKQDHILDISRDLGRPVRFSDLARRWAVDKKYASSIEWVAERYRSTYCRGGVEKAKAAPAERIEVLPWAKQSGAHAKPPSGLAKPAANSPPVTGALPSSAPRARLDREPAPAQGAPSPNAAMLRADPTSPPFDPARNPPAGLGAAPLSCTVRQASYGGQKTLLIRSPAKAETHYTLLTVLDGFEKSMTDTFLKSQPSGSEAMGEFASRDDALAKARELCPGG